MVRCVRKKTTGQRAMSRKGCILQSISFAHCQRMADVHLMHKTVCL